MRAQPPTSGPSRSRRGAAFDHLDHLDRDLSRRIAVTLPRPRWFRLPLSALSLTANYGILWYGIALLPWLSGQPRPLAKALYIAVPVTLVEATGFLVKLLIARQRPPLADPTLQRRIPLPRSKSFPSSHASMSIVGTITVSALYPQALPILVAVTAVLCFSRVYLGVHYVGDVLGGVAYGLLFGSVWVVLVAAPR